MSRNTPIDRGRMASATNAGGTTSFLYNALEHRVMKSGPLVPTGAAYFVYDEEGHVLGEYDASGQPIYEVVWLGDQPVASITQKRTGTVAAPVIWTNVGYIYADHLNTPRVIARSGDHAVLWRWDSWDAYGFMAPVESPTYQGAYPFNLRFPGQVADKETGLFQNHHRDYDPATGRYLQSDPIGLAGGINTYGYVGGNPISFVDPRGLDNPSMGPYGPGPNRGDGSSGPVQVGGALGDFLRNYQNMRNANTIGGDKYFHCMANCQATRRGPAGESTACTISDVREWTDQNVKGDPASASAADQAANAIGRSGALSSSQSCSAVCSGFRPNGLPSRF
jgi:RHS repeat-associated protein